MASGEQLLNTALEHLKSVEKSLRTCLASPKNVEKYMKLCIERLDKFPLECMILEAREAYQKLWIKCLKSEEVLQHVKVSWSEDYTEQVLQKHREELQELNVYYSKNKVLIDKINLYDDVWKCVENVDKQSNDPERLFKNRGAALLKEEHDRKLSNKLPQIEKDILKLLEKRKSEGHEEFLIRGEQFADLAKRRWEQHKENRTRKRLGEQSQKPQSVGPAAKRRHLMDVHQRPQSEVKDLKQIRSHDTASPSQLGKKKGSGSNVARNLKLV